MAILEKARFDPTSFLNSRFNDHVEDEATNPYRSVLEIPTVYYRDILKKSTLATKRVWFQAMYLIIGHATGIIENILTKASQRGVDAQLTIDAITKYTLNDKTIFFGRKPKAKDTDHPFEKEETNKILLRLEANDVLVTVTNEPKSKIKELIPIIGCNHTKITVIDDYVWIGGVNLSDPFFSEGVADFMIRIRRPGVVNVVSDHYKKVNEKSITEDSFIKCDDEYTLLADAGERGKSIIYDEAQKMIDEAEPGEKIVFMSQYLPDGPLLEKMISKARMDSPVTIIASKTDKFHFLKFPRNLNTVPFVMKNILGIKNLTVVNYPGDVHAKLLMVGKRKALFGSHNLVRIGVTLGTQEIAIQTTDPDLLDQLSEFVNVIKGASSYPFTSNHDMFT